MRSTYADLSFILWNDGIPWILEKKYAGLEIGKNYPAYHALHKRRVARPAVVKAFGDRAKAMEEIIERNSQ